VDDKSLSFDSEESNSFTAMSLTLVSALADAMIMSVLSLLPDDVEICKKNIIRSTPFQHMQRNVPLTEKVGQWLASAPRFRSVQLSWPAQRYPDIVAER